MFIILTDIPRPYKSLTTNTKEDYFNYINNMPYRDGYMANKIEAYFKSSLDKDIVGDQFIENIKNYHEGSPILLQYQAARKISQAD